MHGGVKVATSASADLTCWRGAVEWVGGGWVGVGWYRCVCVCGGMCLVSSHVCFFALS